MLVVSNPLHFLPTMQMLSILIYLHVSWPLAPSRPRGECVSCMDNFNARLHMQYFLCQQSGQHQASMRSLSCLNGGEMRLAVSIRIHDIKTKLV